MSRWQPYVQWKKTRLDPKPEQRQPEQRRQFSLVAHGPQVPASRTRCQQGEKSKQRQRARMRGGKIKPTRRPHLAASRVEGDEEEGAHGEQLPNDQEVQAVRAQ